MKIFKKLLICVACICLALGLTACDKKAEIEDTNPEIYSIYEMAVAEGETRSYTEWLEAIRGEDGEDGISPHIDSRTGHWFIGNYDTKIMAQGPQGDKGEKGDDGLTPFVGDNGNWWIGSTDTGVNAGIQCLDADYNEDGFVDFLDAQFLKDCFLGKVEIGENKFSDLNGDGKINATDYLRLSGYGKGYYENEALDRIKYTYSVIFDYNTDLDIETIFDTTPEYLHINKNHTIAGLTLPTVADNNNKYIFKGWYIKGTDNVIDENTYLKGDTTLVAKWIPNLDYNEDGVVDFADLIVLRHWIADGCEYKDNGYAVDLSNKYVDYNGDGYTNTESALLRRYGAGWDVENLNDIDYTYSVIFDYNTDLDIETIFDTTPEYLHINKNHTIAGLSLPTVADNNNKYIFKGWYIEDTDKLVDNYTYLKGDTTLVAKWIPNLDYNEDGFVDYGDIQLLKDCYFHAAKIDDSKYTDLNGDGRITSTDYLRFSGYAKGTYNHEVFDGVEYTYSVLFDYNTDLDIDTIFDTTPEYLHLNNHTIYNVELPNLKENAETGGLTFDGWYIKDTDNKVTQYMYFNGDIELVARWKSAE